MKRKLSSQIRKWTLALALPVAAANLAGCDSMDSTTEAEHVAKAKDFQNKGDIRASVIELKNALLKNPDNLEARRLLGESNAKLGNGADAEKDLRRAIELGMPKEAVLLPLAEALQLQGKHQEIVGEIDAPSSIDANDRARLSVYRGDAWRALNKPDQALAEYNEALAILPNSVLARLGLAYLALTRNDTAQAEKLVAEALHADPKEAKAWAFQGDMQRSRNELEQAEASYGKAIELSDLNMLAHLQRALVRIDLKKLNEASEDINIVKKQAPRFFLTQYAEGWLLLMRKDYAGAQAALDESLKQHKDYLPAIYALGVSHLMQNHLAQAEQHLDRYLSANPNGVQARQLVALAKHRLGNNQRAKEILSPVVQQLPKDVPALRLMGEIEADLGHKAESLEYFRKVAALEPESAKAQMDLGLALVRADDRKLAEKQFEAVRKLDPTLATADIAIITNYLNSKQYDQAIEAAGKFREKQPKSATPLTLMAGAYLAKGDPNKARALLKEAMDLEPSDINAATNLAEMEIRDGHFDEAKSVLEKTLQARPGDLRLLLKLAEAAQKKGDAGAMVAWLEKAVETNPKALQPKGLLGEYYLGRNQPLKVLELTQGLTDVHPDNGTLYSLIGRAQRASGNRAGALASFEKLVALQPKSADALFLLATAYSEAGDSSKAEETLKKALAENPRHGMAKLVMIRLLVLDGQFTEANKKLAELKKDHPDSPEVIDLESWMALREKHPDKAIGVYEAAAKRSPDANGWPVRISQVQWSEKRYDDSFRTLQDWLQAHPDDLQIRMVIANYRLLLGQENEALAEFEKLHERLPDNVVVLNNLAWLLREKDSGKALVLAERAHELAPRWVDASDTLASILMTKGEKDRAVSLLREATAQAPNRPDLAYGLAKALSQSGAKEEARRILARTLESKTPFPQKDAAEALLRELGD